MSGTIKAIDKASIHHIHSGQVIQNLQGAIKELVENSLDAGATSVDVKIKDNGLDTIEVWDNGSGIAEADWESIGMRHHTSKLPSLEELYKVTTFGFRGEALSALCSLCSSVKIITATKELLPMAAVLELGKDGKVVDHSGRTARTRGTTVILTGLLTPLAVRRKEFERNVKKEVAKALTLLTAYALVPASVSLKDGRTGVRLKVEIIGGGRSSKRNTQLATDGKGSLRSAVGAVWGPRALEGVNDVDLDLEVEIDKNMARREGITEKSQTVKVRGLISSAQWGQGRSSADRQFYYINGRPCNLNSVAKAVNEVYKSFNTNQLPLVILDFQIPPQSVDINVSPDKRTIFVHSEDRLIESLKAALDAFFQPARNTFTVEGATQTVKSIRHVQSQLSLGKEQAPVAAEEESQDKDDEDQSRSQTPVDEGQGESKPVTQKQASASIPSSRRASRSVVNAAPDTEADEDDSMEITMTPIATSPTLVSSSSRRAPTSSSTPSRASRVVQQTLNTSQASWSPEKKASQTTSAGKGRRLDAKETRLNLREKLTAYARQRPVVRAASEEEADEGGADDDHEEGIAGEGNVSEADDAKEQGDRIEVEDEDEVMPEESEGEPEVLTAEDQDEELPAVDVEEDEPQAIEVDSETEISQPKATSRRSQPVFEDESPVASTSALPFRRSSKRLSPVPMPPPQQKPSSRRRRRESESSPQLSKEMIETQASDDEADSPQPLRESPRPPSTSRPSLAKSQKSSGAYRDEIISTAPQGEVTMRFDVSRLRARINAKRTSRDTVKASRDAFTAVTQGGLANAAGIANKDAELAEEALSRVISKEDFEKMQVLGQYNKGFIIARLIGKHEKGKRTDDLFIIDQHASDEKYNFETLQQTTKIKGQALIRPRPLQLTASDEIVAMENMPILNANGFDVLVDEDKPAGRGERISLKAMPVSKDTTFDFRDLEQLLHLLSDNSRPSGQMVRCSKARAMFASRACRKSVMIGKALTKNQMSQLLRNMATIDQPWNCPHGRPTMRHLFKLDPPAKPRSGRGRIDWLSWKEHLA
ncbi:hypothetical protein L202_00482 [Cryptococcus amylolentus CBS 6039]|uniref:DNA mismatch repair protein MutL n=1 Tax=Cryptococcus amylolentus CBS 6039 TaxID=1295533 RepID=A0A1E3I7H3_9TREE|nr:hypothetical protein L202_00482 [Cryptococcus amylolentus CBS 6039]ODN84554.1 hypothetical protein L202_00482 [Cryptococcus amylolentus CBS 6039]